MQQLTLEAQTMNKLSKPLKFSALSLAVTIFSFGVNAPMLAYASDTRDGAPKTSAFCTKLPATIASITTNISNRTSKLASVRSSSNQKTETNRAKWDSEITANRTSSDQKRQTSFTKLETKTTDVTKIAAIKAYEITITNLVNTRRAADDQARATYRAMASTAIANQRATTDSRLFTYQSAVKTAETTAQASCQATQNQGSSIRVAFQIALKNARVSYQSNRKSSKGASSDIASLARTRKASFDSNSATFMAAAKTAQTALKSVFGNSKV
jgi:hypothetical protein